MNSLVSVQMDRAEYVFLLRSMEALTETSAFLAHQEKQFSGPEAANQSIVIGVVIPQLDVSIMFPPIAASALQVGENKSLFLFAYLFNENECPP